MKMKKRKTFVGEGTLLLSPPSGEEPEILARVRERLQHGYAGRRGSHPRNLVARLDGERYEDPEKVVAKAERAVATIELERLPSLLGVLGSAWRMLARLDWAEHVIHLGWVTALASGDWRPAAELLQRMSYVAAGRGDFDLALRISRAAAWEFDKLGLDGEVGKTLVDQGIFLDVLGRHEEAIEACDAALELLPQIAVKSRVSAITNKAISYRDLGRLDEARAAARLARDYAAQVETSLRAKILWLEASILIELREDEPVVTKLTAVARELRTAMPVDSALATLDLVRFHLLKGRPQQALEAGQSMLPLLAILEETSIAAAAIADLLRYGIRGMTLRLVEHVERMLLKAKPETKVADVGGQERPRWALLQKE